MATLVEDQGRERKHIYQRFIEWILTILRVREWANKLLRHSLKAQWLNGVMGLHLSAEVGSSQGWVGGFALCGHPVTQFPSTLFLHWGVNTELRNWITRSSFQPAQRGSNIPVAMMQAYKPLFLLSDWQKPSLMTIPRCMGRWEKKNQHQLSSYIPN